MDFHPHIHFVVPGGGIDRETGLWRNSHESFYVPGKALAKVFKALFRELIEEVGPAECADPAAWAKNWVVDLQAVGQNREGVLKYLAPYVFKTAITDKRIVSVDKGKVTFTYMKSGSNRQRRMILDVNEFIRRYLMHVLPSGFMRIRHYGFMGSGCSIPQHELVALVRMAQGFEVDAIEHTPTERAPFLCAKCGGHLIARYLIAASGQIMATFNAPVPKRE